MYKRLSFSFLQIILIVSLFSSTDLLGQTGSNPHGVYLQSKGGFLMAHRSTMAHLVRENTVGLELGFIKHLQGFAKEADYHFPAIGLNIEYRNFGYNEVLGQAVSASYFFLAPIVQKENFFVDFQYGVGMGYISKRYDLESNLTNNAIGSHINAKVAIKILCTKYFKNKFIGFGAELTHFSNGAITYPNLGLNVPSLILQIGLLNNARAAFNKAEVHLSEVHTVKRKHNFLVASIFSAKQVRANPNLPKRYPVFGLRGTYQYAFSKHWSWEGSLDLIHNESNLYFYPNSDFKRADVLQVGIYAGGSYQFYNSEVILGLGYYLRDNINTIGRLYNKIGYRYLLNSKWFGLFNVRANVGKADFFEFGIGYKIR